MNSRKYAFNIQATLLVICVCFFCMSFKANSQGDAGQLRDKDGNSYTIKIMPDDKKWMTTNLNVNIPGSYEYKNAEQKTRQYGRLYVWQSALEACKLLGEGWRLPTNEEWQEMAKWYGGVVDDSPDSGKAAYQALIDGGKAAFNAVYGGRRDATDGNYSRVGDHGFYWTATENDTGHAWLYNFGKNGKMLNRHQDGQKHMALSVRCISDIGNKKGS